MMVFQFADFSMDNIVAHDTYSGEDRVFNKNKNLLKNRFWYSDVWKYCR